MSSNPSAASPLTAQQAAAVQARDVSVVLSSGAGCGKTHVLTERYLSHLRDDGAEVGQIVAITFTDRAAREMRGRIRRAVVQQVKAAADEEAAERWVQHLRGLETAQICTIHAFCGTLLRQHALEIGLDPRFEVLEDVLAANLEMDALRPCLQRLLVAQTPAGDDLRQLILHFGWRPVVEAVRALVRERDLPRWREWLSWPPEALSTAWNRNAREDLLPRYLHYWMTARPRVVRCQALLRQIAPLPGTKMAGRVQVLLEAFAQLAGAADPAAVCGQMADAARVLGTERAKAWPSEEAYEQIKDAFDDLRTELKGLPLHLFGEPPPNVPAAAVVGQQFLRVALEAVESYTEEKRRNARVDFEDLLILTRDLLRDRGEVRERLRQRYRFLLIDELQDTDPVQMELIEHLCGDGLTGGMLFAVGDHSQSIYRFRGADVHLFRGLRERIAAGGRLGLTRNFRSQPAILHFANALLGDKLEAFTPLQAHHTQVNSDPCVEFLWATRADRESVAEARAREADLLALRIRAMLRGERLVVERAAGRERLRPVRAGDIVLLFRAMSNVYLYEAALRGQGLDYYLVGGRAFFAQQEVYDLLNVLRALENPYDAVSLAGTLRSPFCCLSDEALFVFGRHKEGLWAGLHDAACLARLPQEQREAAERAGSFLDRWRTLKDRLPIARLLGVLFADSGFDAATQFESLGDRKLANLWKLQELARTFDRSGLFGLAEFIQRLGDLVSQQPREEQAATQPENADVVRLMSIHQAKGLEFPVVFLPDLGYEAGGAFPPVARWHPQLGCLVRPPADEEEEPPFPDYSWKLGQLLDEVEGWHEELRTLYVACTRAQDYLVLSATLREPFTPSNGWTLALAERFDLRTGACRAVNLDDTESPRVVVTDLAALLEPVGQARLTLAREPVDLPLPLGREDPTIQAVPVRLREKALWTVPEVVRLLGATQAEWAADHLAPQHDAEDGSDRPSWSDVLPRSCGSRDVELASRRAAELLAAAKAKRNYKDVEYALWWRTEADLFGSERAIAVRGILDLVWQDARGAWHGAYLCGERPNDQPWELFAEAAIPHLVFAAWGIECVLGKPARTVALSDLRSGQVHAFAVRDLPAEALRRRIAELFQSLTAGTLPS